MITLGCRLRVSRALLKRSFRYSSICSGRLSMQFNVPTKVKDEIMRHRRRVARIAERAHVTAVQIAGASADGRAAIPAAQQRIAISELPVGSLAAAAERFGSDMGARMRPPGKLEVPRSSIR